MSIRLSPQFQNLWKLSIITLVWKIWMERNGCFFEGKTPSVTKVSIFVKAAILEAAAFCDLGCSSSSWDDYQRGRKLGISCAAAAPSSPISVSWWPPLLGWIKANTDGSAAGCPGGIAAGSVFRDAAGTVRGCFHVDGGRGFACEAELLAAITAVSIAHDRGWIKLWLETDSTYVKYLFSTRTTAVPWRYANAWRCTLQMVDNFDFRISHIYREGNQVADLLADPNTPAGWWPHTISLIASAVARDLYSPCFHRWT